MTSVSLEHLNASQLDDGGDDLIFVERFASVDGTIRNCGLLELLNVCLFCFSRGTLFLYLLTA